MLKYFFRIEKSLQQTGKNCRLDEFHVIIMVDMVGAYLVGICCVLLVQMPQQEVLPGTLCPLMKDVLD